ncbi:DUF1761 domain-containing protein [Robiginitomaculum antarcticum]|uniref:DUF1761 domain-containing protein n=1 Tax=Robiginitomaculum antarcticum TaxID=437507 RepID=UPI0003648B1F|nr:DUF1761 domain-containing protein [Robiginitomaculum antarcticum]
MPKLHNTSILGILLAAVAFWIVGALWYGFIFADDWMMLNGITQAQAEAQMAENGIMTYVYGFLIALAQVIGLNWLINWAGASRWRKCVEVALITVTFIALPVMLYEWNYEGESIRASILDLGHLAVGYGVVGLVLSAFRGKDAIEVDALS